MLLKKLIFINVFLSYFLFKIKDAKIKYNIPSSASTNKLVMYKTHIFKDNLKELMLENNLWQVELAKAIGVSKNVITLSKNGRHEF